VPGSCPAVVHADLLELGPVVRHDPDKLGQLLCELASRRPAAGRPSRVAAGV
jgi:hypothetical protein